MRPVLALAGLPVMVLAAIDPGVYVLIGTVISAGVTWYVAKASQRAQSKQAKDTHQDKVINTALEAAQTMLENYRLEIKEERDNAAREREELEAKLQALKTDLAAAHNQVADLNQELQATRHALVDARESEARLRTEMEAMRAEMRAFRSVRGGSERTRWDDGDADGST